MIRGGALQNQLPDFLVRVHPLKDGVTAEKAGVTALAAAGGFENSLVRRDAKFGLEGLRPGGKIRLLAVRAQHADEALGQHGFEGGGDEIRLHSHVDQAREGPGGVVGVERGEYQMPGERRLHRDLGGLGVADFADQNNVRVVAQNRPEPARKGEPGLFVDLNLIDALELIFNRVFHRDDFADGIVDLVQRGVEGGGFARASRAGDQNDAVRQAENVLKMFQLAGVEPDFAESAQRRILPEQAHHHRLSMQHRDDGNADVDLGLIDPDLDPTVLRQPFFRDVQVT